MQPARALTIVGLVMVVTGCGRQSSLERVVVTGSVQYEGQPVVTGAIRFVPLDEKNPASGALINDGRYKVQGNGGVAVGRYRVRIEAFAPPASAGPTSEPAAGAAPALRPRAEPGRSYLPRKFNEESDLTVTIGPSKQPIEQDFSLVD